MQIESFFDEITNTITHVVADPGEGKCAVIDPVLDYDPASGCTETESADRVLDYMRENRWQCDWILETHAHADHLSAAIYIREKAGGQVAIGHNIALVQETFGELFNLPGSFVRDGSQFDHLFHDGETFSIGSLQGKVIETPGHTPACISYQIEDAVFVGDTMFMPDYGTARCDFPGGSSATLYQSIHKILALPPATRLFMCHDYPPSGRGPAWETTVAEQREKNVHVHEGITEQDFVSMRDGRDENLGMPALIIPSIQVNIRAGALPEAEGNGVQYLKIPLNKLG